MKDLVFDRMSARGPITTRFGETYTIDGVTSVHRGLDIGCGQGTPVVNPALGPSRVVSFSNDGSFGNGVCLDHLDTPWYSLFAHLSRIDVVEGRIVQAGDQLGLSGNTGKSTGPHLHWQVCRFATFPRDLAASADPLSFLRTEPAPAGLAAVVADGPLNLRTHPTATSAVLGSVPTGGRVTLGQDGWVPVVDERGRSGWMAAEFLRMEGE